MYKVGLNQQTFAFSRDRSQTAPDYFDLLAETSDDGRDSQADSRSQVGTDGHGRRRLLQPQLRIVHSNDES